MGDYIKIEEKSNELILKPVRDSKGAMAAFNEIFANIKADMITNDDPFLKMNEDEIMEEVIKEIKTMRNEELQAEKTSK